MPNTKDPNAWPGIRERPGQSVLKQTTTKMKYLVACDAGLGDWGDQMNRAESPLLETHLLEQASLTRRNL